jgi:hypothetical protein
MNDGCWIGLTDKLGNGAFNWIDPKAVGPSFQTSIYYDWQKDQPDNSTISNGQVNIGGEKCVAIMPWVDNPLLQEQGGWNDEGCGLKKSFICQRFTRNVGFTLDILNNVLISGHSLITGGAVTFHGITNITSLNVTASRVVFLNETRVSHSLRLSNNARMDVSRDVYLLASTTVGESTDKGAVPVISVLKSTSKMIIGGCSWSFQSPHVTACATASGSSSNGAIVINAQMNSQGIISVLPKTSVSFNAGGDFARSRLKLQAKDSIINIGGYASKLSTYDAFELSLSNMYVKSFICFRYLIFFSSVSFFAFLVRQLLEQFGRSFPSISLLLMESTRLSPKTVPVFRISLLVCLTI